MLKKIFLACILPLSFYAECQTSALSLKQCIEYAWQNNIEIRQAGLNALSTSIDLKQSKTSLLPYLSLSAGQNYQFGRTVDRFTNTFVNATIRSNNFSLNGGVTLFNGLQNYNNIKKQGALVKASEEDVQDIKNQIALNISSAFLQAIQSDEIIGNARFQIESTTQRIDRAQKLVNAGASDMSNLLILKAQLANEQLSLINAENSKNSAILNLKVLMQMPPEQELDLSLPVIPDDIINNPFNATELYSISIQNMPQIKSAELQSEAARIQTMMTKGNWSPTISFYGSISTVYSQNAKTFTDPRVIGIQPIGFTRVGLDTVYQPVFGYNIQTIGFRRQLQDNLGQAAGLSLSWNLFNGFQVQNAVQKAKISSYSSELNLIRVKNTLLNEINAAVNNYNAAKARYDASRNNVEAQQLSLDYIQKRFDAGASTSFDFINSKNSLLQAQSNEIQSKYELVFRGLILEYYKGNPINL